MAPAQLNNKFGGGGAPMADGLVPEEAIDYAEVFRRSGGGPSRHSLMPTRRSFRKGAAELNHPVTYGKVYPTTVSGSGQLRVM
jgi:hypothetical protein